MLKNIFFFFLVSVALYSCAKNNEASSESGKDYYPLAIDQYKIFEVDSIHIESALDVNDSAHYQIKEVQDSLFTDASGNKSMRLIRYKRYTSNDSWSVEDVWTMHINNSTAQRVEENIRKVLLALPPQSDVQWNRNAFNAMTSWMMEYESLHEDYSINSLDFDSTITVVFEENNNLIARKYGHEIYAKHIGMVQHEEVILSLNDFTPIDENLTWDQIENGTIIRYKLIEYGTE